MKIEIRYTNNIFSLESKTETPRSPPNTPALNKAINQTSLHTESYTMYNPNQISSFIPTTPNNSTEIEIDKQNILATVLIQLNSTLATVAIS
ncbi:8444_t:CDS:2 [Acaulospora morrowiae]|uniref:8444_t:CDS:1 n=1 Tax=Acaulospora morrowiae TaxID=94023 RepID=A0A9N8VVQ7_9GLOM|nr:8444_t:CDS:2 [Acaulospora morrowiae]